MLCFLIELEEVSWGERPTNMSALRIKEEWLLYARWLCGGISWISLANTCKIFQLDSWKERFLGWVTECVQDANINSGPLTVCSMASEARIVAGILLDLDTFRRLNGCELLDSGL